MSALSKVGPNRAPSRPKTGGRQKGTPNAATAAVRTAIEAADPIAFLIDVMGGRVPVLGDEGNPTDQTETPTPTERIRAAEFLARRIVPEAKERPVSFDLDAIDSPADAVNAMAQVALALSSGEILPAEAKALNDALSVYLKAYETIELSDRLDALEASLSRGRAT